MKATCGDASFGDPVITVSVPGAGTLPTLSPVTSEFQTRVATVAAEGAGILDIAFGSTVNNRVVNALTLKSATTTFVHLASGS